MFKILIIDSEGYFSKRLTPLLLKDGHEVSTRSEYLSPLPSGVEVVYYFNCDMNENLISALKLAQLKQFIYLDEISSSLVLKMTNATLLKTSLVIGSGSLSFEIIQNLMEKFPLLIAPCWINHLCQPIAIQDLLYYLKGVLLNPQCLNRTFEVGGPEILSFKDLLLQYAQAAKLKRSIFSVPFPFPRLSAYWVAFFTPVSLSKALGFVERMQKNSICTDQTMHQILPHFNQKYLDTVTHIFAESKGICYKKSMITLRAPAESVLNSLHSPHWKIVKADKHSRHFSSKKKILGEAWLEFTTENNSTLTQTATYRPRGILGRIYWFFMAPLYFHYFKIPTNITKPEPIPQYLYKIVSLQQWEKSQEQNQLILSETDRDFIHLAKQDQIGRVVKKFWNHDPHVILKLNSSKLNGSLIYETNPSGTTKFYHLYDGSIPIDAIDDVVIVRG